MSPSKDNESVTAPSVSTGYPTDEDIEGGDERKPFIVDMPLPSTAASTRPPPWTTRRLLTWTTQYITRKGIDHPRLTAELLLSHTLGVTRLGLYMDPDRPSNDLERSLFHRLIERAARHEPVDYLIGHAPFRDGVVAVDRRVLIPRPSTETLAEHVVRHAKQTPGFHWPLIADIGTGSGAIAIAVAKEIPTSRVIATDVSPEAIEVAQENARGQGVLDRIEFKQGDLLGPIEGRRVHFLVSNPPYISDEEWGDVPACVKNYEPTLALRGGMDGLKYIRPLIANAPRFLLNPGQLVVEIAASQKQVAMELACQSSGLRDPHILVDHEGLPRVLVADVCAKDK